MSETEYNSLLFRISKRLDDINDLEHILFICRGKLEHQADQDIHNTLSLLRKLEDSNFLGVDYLQLVKDILKAVEEWDLHEKVVRFERTRREYRELLERVINVLEGLNDLERLMSTVCRVRRMPEERKNDVHDVRSLIQVLEDINFLGIDCLEILREIFTELKNDELLTELAEFQKHRSEYETRERRKAREAAVWSSARAATQRMIGEIRLHCTFRTLSGVLLLVGPGLILHRSSTLKEYIQAFTVAILPASNVLRAISEGSVCFTVQAETRLALEELYERYSTGNLQKDLQEFLVTDDIIQLADGEEVVVSVYIDEKEFREALDDLTNVDQEGHNEVEGKQSRYLDDERMAFVKSYLENTEDTRSLTTGTSDDGFGSHSAPSDLALEEPGGFTIEPRLKDLSEEVITELTIILRSDEVLCNQFYHSFGLESRHPQKRFIEIENIGKLFPDTPVKLVIDVCRALQLYDLVELLEKAAKPRTLRPALPLKEIAELHSYSNRPTTFYRKVKIVCFGDAEETFHTIRNFFKKTCPGSKYSGLIAGFNISSWDSRIRVLVDQRKSVLRRLRETVTELGERELGELEKFKDEIEKKILEMKGELKEEKKKIKADISSAFDKSWGEEGDDKSTLFVTFQVHKSTSNYPPSYVGYNLYKYKSGNKRDSITGIMMEKLTSFPTVPKLVVSPTLNAHASKELGEIPELLHVEYAEGSEGVVRTILEVLSKRWQTLDLISIIKEAQRTELKKGWNRIRKITDNLSATPRFEATSEQS